MVSKWFGLRKKACTLRQKGLSIRVIEQQLRIPRSTLSGWFKHIRLNENQLQKLKEDWKTGLITARKKAVKWHNEQKDGRLKEAEIAADEILKGINVTDQRLLELTMGLIYLA